MSAVALDSNRGTVYVGDVIVAPESTTGNTGPMSTFTETSAGKSSPSLPLQLNLPIPLYTATVVQAASRV